MPVSVEDVSLGVCDVSFNGLDLGATKGGVSVRIQTQNYEVKVDQFGETPIKDIITGTTVEITVPMAETNLRRLLMVMPQAAQVGVGEVTSVEIKSGVNIDLLNHAHVLFLHPTGVDVAETKHDFTAFKAAPLPDFQFSYETNSERIYEVTFKCYPDLGNDNRIAAFGDTSAIGDFSIPYLVSAVVNAAGDIELTFSEDVSGSVVEPADFTATVNAAGAAITNASVSGSVVTLTMTVKIAGTDTPNSVSYDQMAGTPNSLVDNGANPVATFTTLSIVNNSGL